MLIYTATKAQFNTDVLSGNIASIIDKAFWNHGLRHDNEREYLSWQNSLAHMRSVLDTPAFPDDIEVAVEYVIPQTAKRVDFIISGSDDHGNDNVVLVELKQWTTAKRTRRRDIVKAYVDEAVRDVAHPSYQVWSYAQTLRNYNETVEQQSIQLAPCAYLHNFDPAKLSELTAPQYEQLVKKAPIYIHDDEETLRDFISRYVTKKSSKHILYEIDNGRIRPSKALQDTVLSLMEGNPEFIMIDEQKVVFETVLQMIREALQKKKKYTIIIQGGPGTGKSVVAVQLLSELIGTGYNAQYITKNAAPRNTFIEKMKGGRYGVGFIENLFRSSGSFTRKRENEFDCLLVDEAHRLNEKSGYYANLGQNQIMEIIRSSVVSVFFIDEDQRVDVNDIGTIAQIKAWAQQLGSTVYYSPDTVLKSQFRCNGSDGYIAFLDNLLGIRETANWNGFDQQYDLRVYDSPTQMRDDLRRLNDINNKARMVAGYCYNWPSKAHPEQGAIDITLPDGFTAQWNHNNRKDVPWAIAQDSFEEVGCIHTCQGLEFDYIGVIIGNDLRYENGKVITDVSIRASGDYTVNGLRQRDPQHLADTIIRNTYKVLLTRGQKGCFIYCENQALAEYIKNQVPNTSW